MKRGGPLKRKTPLRAGKPLRRRRPVKPGERTNAEYRKVRRWVADRNNGVCEAQVSGVCATRGYHAHHILPRSAGGPDEPSNLAWVCAPCHAHIHEHPAWSHEAGFLRRAGVA